MQMLLVQAPHAGCHACSGILSYSWLAAVKVPSGAAAGKVLQAANQP